MYSRSNSESATSGKEQISREFEKLIQTYSDAINKIDSIKSKHKKIAEIQTKFLDEIRSKLDDAQKESSYVRDHIRWDALVIGLFGETNAGKSTIIETLRIKFGENNDPSKHGAIVGNGQRDYTKEATEYTLNIQGRKVIIIDIPGIEGAEDKYASIIKNALIKAHLVFYIHNQTKPADEKIASRIKDYLADWAKVYSIWNLRGVPGKYAFEENRQELLSPNLAKQAETIKESFGKILGDNLYIDNIPVQALIALASCSLFPEVERLKKYSTEFRKHFASTEAMYKFSNLDSFVTLLESNSHTYRQVILESQQQKLAALRKRSLASLEGLKKIHDGQLQEIWERLDNLGYEVIQLFSQTQQSIRTGCRGIINSSFNYLYEKGSAAIRKSSDPKAEIISLLNYYKWRLPADLSDDLESKATDLRRDLKRRFDEFKSINLKLPNFSPPTINLSEEVDVDYIVKKLDFSFHDVTKGVKDGARIGSIVPGIGPIVGGILGGVVQVGKQTFQRDYKYQEAQKALTDELDASFDDLKRDLEDALDDSLDDWESTAERILEEITKEASNISKLRKFNSELINGLSK